MKRIKHVSCCAVLLAMAMLLFACGSKNSKGRSDIAQKEKEAGDDRAELNSNESSQTDLEKSALEQYHAIVARAGSYDYNSSDPAEPAGYQYALVLMHTGDTVPTLLLKQQTTESLDYVRIFQYDFKSGTVRQPEDTLMEGVASAGGYRGSLAMQADGNGILSFEVSSGSGESSISRITLEGDALQYEIQWKGLLDEMPDEPGSVGIAWYDVSETGALDNWQSFSE